MGRVWETLILLSCISLTPSLTTTLPKPEISEECEQLGICEKVENYPKELAKQLVAQLKRKTVIFNYDEEQNETTSEERLSNRFGEDITEQILCDSKKMSTAPEYARDRYGTGRYILNVESKTQRFNGEICKRNTLDLPCNGSFQRHLISKCVQNFILKEMYYINETKQSALEYFSLPSCCSCVLLNP